MFLLRWQDNLEDDQRTTVLQDLSLSGLCYGRDNFPGFASAADPLVPSHVVRHEPEERSQCARVAAGIGSWQLQNGLGHAAKMRRAMVRPGRERLHGTVDVDETNWGTPEKGVKGRRTENKAAIVVAAEEDGKGIGRIRLRQIAELTTDSLQAFIKESVETGSVVRTDGLNAYIGLRGYAHERQIQRRQPEGEHLLPHVHRVISLLNRWLLGTLQGAVGQKHLDYYLDEFTFRFNRMKSASRGKLFFRLAQQSVQVALVPYDLIVKPQPVVGGRVKCIPQMENHYCPTEFRVKRVTC